MSVGGEDDKVVLRSVEFWDPSTKIWKTLACLPFAVSKHGLVVSGQGRDSQYCLILTNEKKAISIIDQCNDRQDVHGWWRVP